MKLRIKGNLLRFRLTCSELAKPVATGRLEETIYFSLAVCSGCTYALEHTHSSKIASLQYRTDEILTGLYTMDITSFAETDRLGIYTEVDLGLCGSLELLIENDFACLNSSDASADDRLPPPFGDFG